MTKMATGQELQRQPQIISTLLKPGMIEQLRLCLPKHLTPERFLRMMLTCIRNTPKLAQCDQLSVLSQMFELAQLGLEPNTPLGHAWILPYGSTAQAIIGYKGYVALAYRSGVILNAEYVWDGDQFDYALGTDQFIQHRRGDPSRRQKLVAAYSVGREAGGRVSFKVIDQGDVDHAKLRSQAWQRGQRDKSKQDSPWYTAEHTMWAKTAIRRHAPFLPLSAEFARALEIDQQADDGKQDFVLPENLLLQLPATDAAKRVEDAVQSARSAGAESTANASPAEETATAPPGPSETPQQERERELRGALQTFGRRTAELTMDQLIEQLDGMLGWRPSAPEVAGLLTAEQTFRS